MKFKHFIALLLVLSTLFVSFVSCKEETVNNESSEAISLEESSKDEVSITSEPERIDGTALYEKSAKNFEESENIRILSEYTKVITAGTETRTESGKADELFLSYGKKDMSYYCEEEIVFDEERTVKIEETLLEDTVFLLYDGKGFYSPVENDYEFCILDAELYGEITQLPEKDKEGNTVITFTGAEAVEGWLAYEYAVLDEASAEVVVDDGWNIVSLSYNVKYEQGAAYNEVSYSFTVAEVGSPIPEIKAPENIKDYLEVDSVNAVIVMDEAVMNLAKLGTYRSESTALMYAEGIGSAEESTASYSVFEYGEDFASEMKMNRYTMWYDINKGNMREDSLTSTTTIIDGVKSTDINGSKSEAEIEKHEIVKYKKSQLGSLTFCVPDIGDIKNIELSSVDGYITATVQCNREHGDSVFDSLGDSLENFDYFDDISSDFDTDKNEFFITVDADTFYPVAFGTDFEGKFKFDGRGYPVGFERNVSITPASPEIYKDITDKRHPEFDKEPADEDKAQPLFYKVTDASGNTMWLLGTIHVGDNRTGYLPAEIYKAFDESDAVAFEIDVIALNEDFELGEDEELIDIYLETYYYEDDSIEDNIDETLYRDAKLLFDALGLGSYGDYINRIEYMKPNYWSSLLDNTYLSHSLGVYYSDGVDMRLLERAKADGKKVYELEDRLRQFTMNNEFSESVHELSLYSAVYYPRWLYRTETIEMYEAWCNGDAKQLSETVNEEPDFKGMSDEEIKAYEEYTKALTDDRDELMLKKAKEYIASGETVFVAVGLAHLLDEETGLLNALEDAGYTVEQVEYN